MRTNWYTGCAESVNHGGVFLLTRIDSVGAESMHGDMALAGFTNLRKHVGQRVSVARSLSDDSMGTTRQDVSTRTVETLKVIAKSCS
jgi:hypothetical protein